MKFKAPLIASLIVIAFAVMFHNFNVTPHDWNAVAMWMPLYLSPIWGATGLSYLSERGKK